jgi:hypothetical protein
MEEGRKSYLVKSSCWMSTMKELGLRDTGLAEL